MKVVRIYDDKKKLYNNVDWVTLCSEKVSVEYCTFENRNPLRIVVDKSYKNTTEDNWEFNPDNNYYVFLDTLWDSRLIDQSECISGQVEMPLGLIQQFEQPCVSRVIVYTTYDKDGGQKLFEALRGIDYLVNKLGNRVLQFHLFQQEQIIRDIRQEVE